VRAFLLSIILSANLYAGETITGRVVGITDGDSIKVLEEDDTLHKVRLEGIDAPEAKQDFGQTSKKALSDLVFEKTVTLQVTGHDRYKRMLAVVKVGETNVNTAMVRAGMAWHFTRYSKDQELAAAEQEARQAKRGLWQQAAIPPWEFRKRK
jgi:micrococcal nuclease